MRKPVRIAHRHDAALTASNADPASLSIKAPCKVIASPPAMPCLSIVVSSLCACPVTTYEIHDSADLPLDRTWRSISSPSRSSRATSVRHPGPNEPVPISPMRRVRSEELLPRENCERPRRIRTAFRKAQDFLVALRRADCDVAMTASEVEGFTTAIAQPTV
jgi:hypothetical protein